MIIFFVLLLAGLLFFLGYFLYYDIFNDNPGPVSRDFITMAITLIANFAYPLTLGILGVKLILYKDRVINMNTEIITIVVFWTFAAALFHWILFRYMSREEDKRRMRESFVIMVASALLLMRNIVIFIVSIVHPVVKETVRSIMTFGETRECVGNVDITLSTELPYLYFSGFVEEKYKANGTNTVILYTQIKMFEDMVKNGASEEAKMKLANTIMEEFLVPNALLRVEDIPESLEKMIKQRL